MYINSIKGLHTIVKSTELYSNKRPTEKKVLIDKVNLFVSYIIGSNFLQWDINDFDPVHLNSQILRSQLGAREYLNIIRLLKDNGIINVDNSYLACSGDKSFSKTFGLTDKAKLMGKVKAGILSKRIEDKEVNRRLRLGTKFLSDPIHSKIINSLFQLKFREGKARQILIHVLKYGTKKKTPREKHYYQSSFNMLVKMNNCTTSSEYFLTDGFYYTVSDLVGRTYHYINTVPKPFRKCLIHDSGEIIAEIDLQNAQPFLLGMEYLTKTFFLNKKCFNNKYRYKVKKENREVLCSAISILQKEQKKLFKVLINGELYEKVAKEAKKRGDFDFYELFVNDYGEFKKQVLAFGFYDKLRLSKNQHKANKYLISLFPNFMRWIKTMKEAKDYRLPSIKAQTCESDIFIYEFFAIINNLFSVSNHDSILTTKNNAKDVKNTLKSIIQKKYPILEDKHLIKLFKTQYYD